MTTRERRRMRRAMYRATKMGRSGKIRQALDALVAYRRQLVAERVATVIMASYSFSELRVDTRIPINGAE